MSKSFKNGVIQGNVRKHAAMLLVLSARELRITPVRVRLRARRSTTCAARRAASVQN